VWKLFNALQEARSQQTCDDCGKPKHLHLGFRFATGSGITTCKVLRVFLPQKIPSWTKGKQRVEFYPFLVILDRNDNKQRAVWLPYWHKIGKRLEYGQWAPVMDAVLFKDLWRQARASRLLPT
jgi:hypothetical protein